MNRTEKKIQAYIRQVATKGRDISFSVIGAGHGGLAMAGHLAIMGFKVNLYNRTDERLNSIRWHGGVRVSGQVDGFGKINLATSKIKEAIEGTDVVMIVTPATAHASLAKKAASVLHDGQIVILNPGRTGGAMEFTQVLVDKGNKAHVLISEAQTFLYASRSLSHEEAHIYRIKSSVQLATLPAFWIPDVLSVIKNAFPQFIAGSNVLTTSLDNIGAVFHPALTLLNAGWIESTHGDFNYYTDGVTKSTARILEMIDQERMAVAAALGIRVPSAREWLYMTYDSPGQDLFEAIQNTVGYKGLRAPSTTQHRYILEDVPMSLVPIASLGEMLGVSVQMIKDIIRFASVIHETDYWKTGRTVEKLGIAGMTVKQIRQWVVGIH